MLAQPLAVTAHAVEAIERLNAVPVRGSHIEAALAVLAALPPDLRTQPAAQAVALQHYAEDQELPPEAGSAALHARLTALAKWTTTHDPARQSAPEAVMEAAARFPLSDGDAGVQFEPAGFQEMVLFIEELPW